MKSESYIQFAYTLIAFHLLGCAVAAVLLVLALCHVI